MIQTHKKTAKAYKTKFVKTFFMKSITSLGKTLFQFRNFVTTAYSKQLLHGLHMRDFTFFSSFMTSTMLAGLVYVGQQYAQAVGKTGEERDDFLERRLSPEAIGGATFQRNTYSTLLPAFIDTGAYLSGVDPFLNYRSSGLETNVWTGNPTWFKWTVAVNTFRFEF